MSQTILVLGGGVGGVVTAVELRKKLPAGHRIVLVDREERHVFAPSLLWLMTGARTAEKISRPLERLSRRGIEVVRGAITSIDAGNRRVEVGGRVLEGGFLVISLGADFAPEVIPGLAETGYDFCTLAGAQSLRDALHGFRAGRLVVMTAAPAYKCPAAPYEAAMLLEHDCRRRGVRDQVTIDLYAAEPGPMGVAGPEVSAAVREMVTSKGIGYHPEHQVTNVDGAARRLTFANRVTAEFDLLAHVPPIRAPKVVRDAGLTAESGWVAVDRNTMATRFEGVYAIGDVTGIPLKLGKPLPKAGVFAHAQASVVARNIARAVTGKGEAAAFDGHGECFVEVGHGRAGFGKGDFYAEPVPIVRMHRPALRWHWGKVLLEKDWLRRWF
ncbi:MAG: NAD(P)/FAD-dependent oxidoreductase [Deltaproteobacteria bacterium]|nr:NAD(P)/FAD-dependent oxidoreductase [Deltaproteobacteria bacterium]